MQPQTTPFKPGVRDYLTALLFGASWVLLAFGIICLCSLSASAQTRHSFRPAAPITRGRVVVVVPSPAGLIFGALLNQWQNTVVEEHRVDAWFATASQTETVRANTSQTETVSPARIPAPERPAEPEKICWSDGYCRVANPGEVRP